MTVATFETIGRRREATPDAGAQDSAPDRKQAAREVAEAETLLRNKKIAQEVADYFKACETNGRCGKPFRHRSWGERFWSFIAGIGFCALVVTFGMFYWTHSNTSVAQDDCSRPGYTVH